MPEPFETCRAGELAVMPYVNQHHLFFPQIVGIDHSDTVAINLVMNKRKGAKGRPNFIDMTSVQLFQEAAV